MCGRSSLTKTEKEIEDRFNATFYTDELERYNPLPNYNVAPSHMCPVITNKDPEHLQLYRWGLVPHWAKNDKMAFQMINARKETLLEKAAFKTAVTQRRCIIPMDGFYEWKKDGKEKIPYRIITTDKAIFSVAGLWERWPNEKSEDLYTFTIITQGANILMESIHDRMPAILTESQEQLWLSDDLSATELMELIEPYPCELMKAYRVSSKIGNVKYNSKDLIEPIVDRPSSIQGSFF